MKHHRCSVCGKLGHNRRSHPYRINPEFFTDKNGIRHPIRHGDGKHKSNGMAYDPTKAKGDRVKKPKSPVFDIPDWLADRSKAREFAEDEAHEKYGMSGLGETEFNEFRWQIMAERNGRGTASPNAHEMARKAKEGKSALARWLENLGRERKGLKPLR